MASGCMVPIRCIISIGVEVETTVALPLFPVSVIELTFIEKASIQSAGESPIFTWTVVLAVGVGVGVVPVLAELPPPQALSVRVRSSRPHAMVTPNSVRGKVREETGECTVSSGGKQEMHGVEDPSCGLSKWRLRNSHKSLLASL